MKSSAHVRLFVSATAAVLALAFLPSLAGAASAGILVTTRADYMQDDGLCSLREAVRSANLDRAVGGCPAGSGDDTILVPPGPYRLTWNGTQGENEGLLGDLDIWTRMTIRGTSQVPSIIDGAGTDRVIHVIAGARVVIERMTISGGSTVKGDVYNPDNPNPSTAGGGIANHGNLTIVDSLITGNSTAQYGLGGGIFNSGMLTIRDSWITDNFADSGGGLYSTGSAYLVRTHVDTNVASGYQSGPPRSDLTAGGAGGITSTGYLNVLRSVIANNAGHDEWGHGGIAVVGGVIRDSVIEGNWTVICGTGGISMVRAKLIGTTVSGNDNGNCGPGAGGVYAVDSEIVNSTISGNHAYMAVAGIRSERSRIVNSTITLNSTAYIWSDPFKYVGAGGLLAEDGQTVVRNTIIAGNLGGNGGPDPASVPDCEGIVISGGHNLIGSTTGCDYMRHATDQIGVDPMLGPLADNGGFSRTHALRPGSPAIDAWYDGFVGSGATCPKFDQRGVHRPQDGDGDGIGKCDVGALERT